MNDASNSKARNAKPAYGKNPLTEELRRRLVKERTVADQAARLLTRRLGSLWFLILNAVFFALWIGANLELFGVEPFDPFPFGLLTLIVSLEAIFLSIIVLMSQNIEGKEANIRGQLDFEVDVRAEDEITQILILLDHMREHLKVPKLPDEDIEEMKKRTDLSKLQKEMARHED